MESNAITDDKSVLHLELGAGCGNFGKIHYPKCYLTDYDAALATICEKCYIDYFCDAHNLPWKNNRFDKIIMCNPYGYGFLPSEERTKKLLTELLRVLKNKDSEIIVIGHKRNKYCSYKNIQITIDDFMNENKQLFNLEVVCDNPDFSVKYGNYIFRTIQGVETKPSHEIKIYVK